jgi:copper transport protein
MNPRRFLLVLAAALMLAAAFASPASAHAIIRSTTPGDGEALDAGPASVSLEFNEPVTMAPGGLRVFDSDGARVDAADADATGEEAAVTLQPDLPDGTYVVSWRALSADSHPVHGAFVFTVGDGEADDAVIAQILQSTSDTGMQAVAAVLRFLQYASALIAAGGAFFLIWIHDRNATERPALLRIVTTTAIVAAVISVIGVLVQAVLVTGLGSAATDPAALSDVMASSFGISAVAVLAGLAILLTGARRLWDDWAVIAAATGAVVTVGAFALTGHSAGTQPRWLVMTADVVHTTAAAAWFGGLVLLRATLRRRKDSDDAVGGAVVVSRFSAMAFWSVVVLSIAGTALGWAEVRALRALTSTAYGWTLVAKVGLVIVILAVAAYNQRKLVPAIQAAGTEAWTRLRSTVRLEVLGLVLVIGITAVLVNLIPARDAAGITGPLSERRPLGEEHFVDITVDPNRVGRNEVHIYVFSNDGRSADAEEISVGLTLPAEDIGPIEREPTPTGPGHWTLTQAELPIAGRWIVTIDVTLTRFEQVQADIPIDVGG